MTSTRFARRRSPDRRGRILDGLLGGCLGLAYRAGRPVKHEITHVLPSRKPLSRTLFKRVIKSRLGGGQPAPEDLPPDVRRLGAGRLGLGDPRAPQSAGSVRSAESQGSIRVSYRKNRDNRTAGRARSSSVPLTAGAP